MEDIVLDGFASWVGNSSAETTVRAYQKNEDGIFANLMEAKFVMVSLDYNDLKQTLPLPSLKCETSEEGVQNTKQLKSGTSTSLLFKPPTAEEAIWRVLGPNQVPIGDTIKSTSHLCFPQNRNYFGNIFGDYIMRIGVESTWRAALAFAKSQISIISINNVKFIKPVSVGSILDITSTVTYVKGPCMQVRVFFECSCPTNSFKPYTSNTMQVTFKCPTVKHVPELVPQLYNHGMLYLNGKRYFQKGCKRSSIRI
uniref:HotDog ACOT-type domain-containing protein n=1 Tax=Rhabditophanes sp. KR3021 TaxID=114890 RepID=A0AC35U1U4_9BILA